MWGGRNPVAVSARMQCLYLINSIQPDKRIKDEFIAFKTSTLPQYLEVQLLNVCLNKPVQDRIQVAHTERIAYRFHKLTHSNSMKHASLQDLTRSVKDAWYAIPSGTVSKVFTKCGILNMRRV